MNRKTDGHKILLLFGTSRLGDMLKKGNVWYVRNYEAYFDKVFVVYLFGDRHEPVVNGKTTLVSLGTGNDIVNLILSPFRIYMFSKTVKPTNYLTADLVFSWWHSWLIKLFLKAKIFLMPVCIPEQIFTTRGRALSRLRLWLKQAFVYLSFIVADRVLTGRSFGSFVEWLSSHPLAKRKLVIVNTLVDALPSITFFEHVDAIKGSRSHLSIQRKEVCLIYVGRLHREKMVEALIKMMAAINRIFNHRSKRVILKIIGDGPEKQCLEVLAKELKVRDVVYFIGSVANENLPEYLMAADVFVSPLTGTSLREAALCGLPIVAYNMDWISGLLKHDETALLVPPGDYAEMARQVIRVTNDFELHERLSNNVKQLAWQLWSPRGIHNSLRQAFELK